MLAESVTGSRLPTSVAAAEGPVPFKLAAEAVALAVQALALAAEDSPAYTAERPARVMLAAEAVALAAEAVARSAVWEDGEPAPLPRAWSA
jgi:hypothetical protein